MEIQTKYNLGQIVYAATTGYTSRTVDCGDCTGSGLWSVTKPNGEAIEVNCPTCEGPWGQRSGTITEAVFGGNVEVLTIGLVRAEVEIDRRRIQYMCHETGVGSGRCWEEDVLFLTREAAQARADEMAIEHQQRLAKEIAGRAEKKRGDSLRLNAKKAEAR
ncbi:MAG: hypothetical protein KGR26_13570 [Cyanobacteria bacterium REEB65]|nr:hypothetical protein [Cyanobacteria bacterium REEB65]